MAISVDIDLELDSPIDTVSNAPDHDLGDVGDVGDASGAEPTRVMTPGGTPVVRTAAADSDASAESAAPSLASSESIAKAVPVESRPTQSGLVVADAAADAKDLVVPPDSGQGYSTYEIMPAPSMSHPKGWLSRLWSRSMHYLKRVLGAPVRMFRRKP